MDIKALREMLSKNELSISDEAYSSLIDKFDTSDDGKLSAKEISAMISKYNTDNNLDEFSDSEIEQMAYDVCGFSDETLSHIPSDAKTYIRDGFKNMLSGFFSKVQSDDVQKTSADPTAPKYAQKDEDGKYYVDVEPWTSSGKRKNDVDTKGALLNNCPERIIKNAYPDIEPYSDQWNQLVNLVMEANPNIYGPDSGRTNNGINTYIYDSDKYYLPTIKNNDGTLEVVEPEKTTTETTTQYYGSDLITTETVKNADGQVITETIKDKDGNVTNIANYTYGEDGSRTIKNTDVDGNLKSEYTYDKNDRITKGVEYKDGKETKITTINWTDDSINGARTAIIEDREAGTITTNVMDSTGKQISQVITDLDGNVISSEAKMTTEEAKEKIADLSDRNGYVSEDDYQKRVSDEVLKNLTADQIKELNTTDNGYGHSYLWSYSTRLNALGYDQALTTLKSYGLTEDQSTKILDALSISKTPVSITPEVTDPPPSSGSVDTSAITPEESIIINGKLDLIDEYLNNENYEGSVSNSRALADELLNMDSALLAKIAKSYNAIHSGKDFASDMFNFYMDNDNDNHKFKNFDKQLALAKKLFPVQTGTLTEEQKQQALTVAQDCLSIIQINNGVWADGNKKDFIANLKSLTPEQIALVQQTFDSQIAQWYPVASIPGMDKDTSTFKFADMVKKYLSSNWVGGGKWNDQSPDLMRLLAQSGII